MSSHDGSYQRTWPRAGTPLRTTNARQSRIVSEVNRFKRRLYGLDRDIANRTSSAIARGWKDNGFKGLAEGLFDAAMIIASFKSQPGYHDRHDVRRAEKYAHLARRLAHKVLEAA